MNFNEVIRRAMAFTDKNASTLLTGVGVVGTVTTAYLTGKATFKAARVLDAERMNRDTGSYESYHDFPRKEQIGLTWKLYLPAVGVGTATVASIVMANRISSKQAAALAAAYGLSERAFSEYKEKVVKKLGENKEKDVRDEIAADKVKEIPVNSREVIIAGAGEVLFMDSVSGRYFQSTMEEVKKAVNKVNFDILNHMYASLSSFYEELGLPPTAYSDGVGWRSDEPLDVNFTTTLTTDDRPCIVLDFTVEPKHGYNNLY